MKQRDTTQHADLLKELHGDPSDAGLCDTILVVNPDEGVREVILGILKPLFPGYEFAAVSTEAEAIARISGDLNGRVALLIASVEDLNDSNARAVLESIQLRLESIRLRSGPSQEIGEQKRWEVLNDFVNRYKVLVPLWIERLESFSFPEGSEEEDYMGSILASTVAVCKAIGRMGEFLQEVGEDGDFEGMRRIFHDIKNDVMPLTCYTDMILMDADLPEGDLEVLRLLLGEVDQFVSYVGDMHCACNETSTLSWTQVAQERLIVQVKQKLELPKDCIICVVDDKEGVRKVCSKMIAAAGGKAYEASDEASLRALAGEADDVQVFLLDHDLGEGRFGHELIEPIRERWPRALIIAHTSNAADLNADPENFYNQAGIEIVDKQEWKAISGIVRQRLR